MRTHTGTSRARTPRERRRRLALVIALAAIVVGGGALSVARARRSTTRVVEPVARGRAAQGAVAPAAKPAARIEFKDGCVTAACHAGLSSAARPHRPVEAGACDACHAADAGGHVYPLLRRGEALCATCHASAPGHKHPAIAAVGCTACHDPHGSSSRGMLAGKDVPATCAACHPGDEVMADGPAARAGSRHASYAAGACTACHDPHDSPTRAILTNAGRSDAVGGGVGSHCAACHEGAAVATAMSSHASAKIPGSCTSCHAAHASPTRGLLAFDAADGCTRCHESVATAASGPAVGHGSVMTGDRCVTCHEPHGSGHGMMLRDSQGAVCLSCHADPIKASDGRTVAGLGAVLATAAVVHGPVRGVGRGMGAGGGGRARRGGATCATACTAPRTRSGRGASGRACCGRALTCGRTRCASIATIGRWRARTPRR